jgi:hypothetical protein
MTALSGWENFYVIAGSSAGALIGLQFVVMTLIASRPIGRGQAEAGATFATPTVVHFGAVLLLAGIQTAPWSGVGEPAALWLLLGLSGIIYEIVIARRMRTQTIYAPVFEDWLFHAILPLLAYGTLAASAYGARFNVSLALYPVGAAAMLLLFIGIHNAWDTVTYHILERKEHRESKTSD